MKKLIDQFEEISCIDVNGQYLAVGAGRRDLYVLDINSGEKIIQFESPHNGEYVGGIECVSFFGDGNQLLSCGSDDTIKLWDWKSNRLVFTFKGHNGTVYDACFSPNGEYILSGSSDKTMRLWSASNMNQIHQFIEHEGEVKSVGFSPNNKFLVSKTSEGLKKSIIRIWDFQNKKILSTIEENSYSGHVCSFSPDGRLLIADIGMKLCFWETNNFEKILEIESDNHITDCRFSPDSKYICSGHQGRDWTKDGGIVNIWNVKNGEKINSFLGHKETVTTVAFASNNEFVFSGASSGEVIQWDLRKNGEPVRKAQDAREESESVQQQTKPVQKTIDKEKPEKENEESERLKEIVEKMVDVTGSVYSKLMTSTNLNLPKISSELNATMEELTNQINAIPKETKDIFFKSNEGIELMNKVNINLMGIDMRLNMK